MICKSVDNTFLITSKSKLAMPKICTLILFICSFGGVLFGQKSTSDFSRQLDQKLTPEKFTTYLNTEYDIDINDLIIKDKTSEIPGIIHEKRQQQYNGLSVLGNVINVHFDEGLITGWDGHIGPIGLSNEFPELDNNSLIQILDKKEAHLSINNIKQVERIVVDKQYPLVTDEYCWAYIIKYNTSDPFDSREAIINAETKKIIDDRSILCFLGVPGKGETKYYGEQEFIVDSLAPDHFVLRDPVRNISTYSAKTGQDKLYTMDVNTWDLQSPDQDEVALDAHHCTSKFHDMMSNKFQWQGIDNLGGAMDPVVHMSQGAAILNAYWDGQNAVFGNGDCHHSPLTTYSVVGHEFMHGITDYSSDLIYANESGAINESMSDIFGKALEYYNSPATFSWDLGPEFHKTDYGRTLRSLSNPNKTRCPKLYQGKYWSDGGAVHTNSGVFNYWFYLMTSGGQGTNELGTIYNVLPHSFDDVLELVFLVQRAYLFPSSDYNHLYQSTLKACEELFGANSTMQQSVIQAWKACGIPREINININDLAISYQLAQSFTCLGNEKLDVEFTIQNSGNHTYSAGSQIQINLYSPDLIDSTFFITLEQDLNGNEYINYVLEEALHINETKEYFISISILDDDDNNSNNRSYDFLANLPYSTPTARLFPPYIVVNECFSNKAVSETYLFNASCEELPQNGSIELDYYQEGTLIHKQTIILERSIAPGSGITIIDSLDLLNKESEIFIDQGESTELNYWLTSLYTDVDYKPEIKGSYHNTCDDLSILEDLETNNIHRNYYYENDSKLGIFGVNYGTTPCLSAEENINSAPFGNATIKGCFDLSEMKNNIIEFELIQFRTDQISQPEFKDFTSVCKVVAESDQERIEKIIWDQQEGITHSHTIALPDHFFGEITFEFFNHQGSLDSTNLDYDASLINNISIKSVTSTMDHLNEDINIYPNPTSDELRLNGCSTSDVLGILDITGKEYRVHRNSPQELNVSQYPNGIYIIQVQLDSGQYLNKRFIKLGSQKF